MPTEVEDAAPEAMKVQGITRVVCVSVRLEGLCSPVIAKRALE